MKMSDFMLIEASGSKPKVAGLAYSGGKMNLPGWKFPVVVDLAGMEIPDTVPLLTNHENKTDARVGVVTASIKDSALEISGEIVSDSKDAQDIVAQGKSGADWQLSIGADVRECELVKGSREINGQTFDGPFYHVQKSVLREVSVVAVGADAATKMKVTAQFNLTNNSKGDVMTDDEKKVNASGENNGDAEKTEKSQIAPDVKAKAEMDLTATAQEAAVAAVKAERERVSAIQAICAGEFPEIEKEAVSAGWTPDVVTKKVLETIRAERPAANVNIAIHSKPEGEDMRKTVEAAMCLRVGVDADTLEKSYGAKTVEAAMVEMDMPLKQVMIECMKMDGIPYSRGFDNETIRAAFSSVSLPGILSNVANKKLLQSYEAQPVIATKLCSTGDLNDFKETERFRLTDVGDLLPIAPDGEIKDGGLIEEGAKNQLETYGKKFCLTRKMIINDDLGAFMKVPVAMGNRAARLIDQLFFSRLLQNPTQADGKALFSSGFPFRIVITDARNTATASDGRICGIDRFTNGFAKSFKGFDLRLFKGNGHGGVGFRFSYGGSEGFPSELSAKFLGDQLYMPVAVTGAVSHTHIIIRHRKGGAFFAQKRDTAANIFKETVIQRTAAGVEGAISFEDVIRFDSALRRQVPDTAVTHSGLKENAQFDSFVFFQQSLQCAEGTFLNFDLVIKIIPLGMQRIAHGIISDPCFAVTFTDQFSRIFFLPWKVGDDGNKKGFRYLRK